MSDPVASAPNAGAIASQSPAPDPLRVLEAILFSGGNQTTVKQLIEITELDEDQIVQAIAQLNQQYFHQARPYEIRRSGDAYQMILRPQFARIGRRLVGRSREVRLSVAAIEVLALVAYRQPTTLRSIDAVRGVDSSPIVRQLRRRNLIELAPPDESEDRSERFKTTKRFLQLFQLTSLDDLPRAGSGESLVLCQHSILRLKWGGWGRVREAPDSATATQAKPILFQSGHCTTA